MSDILFRRNDYIVSFRVGAVLIHDGKILLQKVPHDDGYALLGGHVSFGETSADALCRGIKEELHADIRIERPLIVGENFCPWGSLPCQQINIFYLVSLCDASQIPLTGSFLAYNEIGNLRPDLEMSWISLSKLSQIKLYPSEAKEILMNIPDQITYFVHYPN